MTRLYRFDLAVAILAFPSLLLAVPGASAQALTAEAFSRHAEVQSVTLSPGGKHVALAVPVNDGMETQLQVVKLDGSGDTQVLRFGKQQHVSDVIWSDDDRIVVSRARMQPLKALPVSYGELISSNIEGKEQEILFAYATINGTITGKRRDQGFASVVKVLENEPGKVLVRFTCWSSVCGDEPPTVIYKVDTASGSRDEVERVPEPAVFDFDRSGRARIMTTWDENDDPVLHYRPGADNTWQPMPKSLAGRDIGSTWFDPDNNTVYAEVSDAREPGQLYKLDLAAGTRTRLLGRDDVGIAYMMYEGYRGKPFAVVYSGAAPQLEYIDATSEWAQLHAAMLARFKGQMVNIQGASRDGQTILFTTWSDRNPGTYYLFDRKAGAVQQVATAMSWIDPGQMASTRPITFTGSDGTVLHGLVTAKGSGPHPMVVMPHGGPYGIYDSWGYDADAQFLASRGYAVLRVNFRGSGGRGQSFIEAGYREWGGKIQDDIADGVKWAIANGIADKDRICTYGASFGGYSALMNPIRYPELYKCAIGYVGVYDLQVMHEEGDIKETDSGRDYLDRVLGNDQAVLIANSPAQQVDRIKVPVFLVAGRNDRRVPMDQFDAQVRGFKDAGVKVETLVVGGEGHGFYKPENRENLYNRMEAFLGKYIGPGGQ